MSDSGHTRGAEGRDGTAAGFLTSGIFRPISAGFPVPGTGPVLGGQASPRVPGGPSTTTGEARGVAQMSPPENPAGGGGQGMWGTQPEADAPPAPDRLPGATPHPVTPLLVVGAPGSELATLKAILVPLGQPVLEAAPWSEELEALLTEDPGLHPRRRAPGLVRGLRDSPAAARPRARPAHPPALPRGQRLRGSGPAARLWAGDGGLPARALPPGDPPRQGGDVHRAAPARAGDAGGARAGRAGRSGRARERAQVLRTLLGNLRGMAYRCPNDLRATPCCTPARASGSSPATPPRTSPDTASTGGS